MHIKKSVIYAYKKITWFKYEWTGLAEKYFFDLLTNPDSIVLKKH